MSCEKGCVQAHQILQLEYELDCGDRDMEDLDENELQLLDKKTQFESYNETASGDFGHENYAAAAYATFHGHLACLQEIFETDGMWHNDLAVFAAESGQLECLQFIIETMGDVDRQKSSFNHVTCQKCLDYMQNHYCDDSHKSSCQ